MLILQCAETPDIIESEDMVRMGMGQKDRIHAGDPEGQHLVAEIGRRIEDQMLPFHHHIQAAAPPRVFYIGGGADRARTPGLGDAVRGSGSKEGGFHG